MDFPSPGKKPAYARTDDDLPRRDPTDPRGTLAQQARTPWADEIKARAFKGRAGVNLGYSLSPSSATLPAPSFPSRRPLGPSRTEPHLSFAPAPTWQSGKDIVDQVYAVSSGKRAGELRPMYETGSQDGGAADKRAVEGHDSGFFGGATPTAGMDVERDVDGDGFDLDEAFGPAKTDLAFGLLGRQSEADDSQNSASTTRTVTHRLKRAFVEEQGDEARVDANGDDDDMAPTDVEDEGDDQPAPLGGALSGARKMAGSRRAWGKTQSLPASAFESMVEF